MPSTITKSVRISREEAREIGKIAEAEAMVEANLLKKFLHTGLASYRLERALGEYSKGRVSLREAAHMARLGYLEFFEEVKKRRISLLDPGVDIVSELLDLAKRFGDRKLERVVARRMTAQSEEV